MLYLSIKALHVLAIVVWTGSLLSAALLLCSMRPVGGPFILPEDRLLAVLQHWDRRITTPAMASAWGFGVVLGVQGHWFASVWLSAKLVLVLALSALHGVQAAALRRLVVSGARRKPDALLRFAPAGILLAVTLIVALVILKPF